MCSDCSDHSKVSLSGAIILRVADFFWVGDIVLQGPHVIRKILALNVSDGRVTLPTGRFVEEV
jgi:hypothetical protein